jgi:hypothetical protein
VHQAVINGNLKVLKLLLKLPHQNVNQLDMNGRGPVHHAVINGLGHLEAVKLLLEHPRTDVSCADKRGNTMLHFAAEHGRVNIITYLLSVAGINTRCKNSLGDTPLARAFLECKWAAMRLLAEYEGLTLPLVFDEVTGEWLSKDTEVLFSLIALTLERGEVVVDAPHRWWRFVQLFVRIGGNELGRRFVDTYFKGRRDQGYFDHILG